MEKSTKSPYLKRVLIFIWVFWAVGVCSIWADDSVHVKGGYFLFSDDLKYIYGSKGIQLKSGATTITGDADDYARKVLAAAEAKGLRASLDVRNEKINYKVREHSLAKVPAILVAGNREAEENTISVRRLGEKHQKVLPLDEALDQLVAESIVPGS